MNSRLYKRFLYDVRGVRDIRDLINTSCELFSDNTAYLVKERPGGKYLPIKFKKVREDILFFGTSLVEADLLGKKVAVIGENSYTWILTYLSVVCGGGIIVPIDRELPPDEIANLLNRSGAEAIVYSTRAEETLKALVAEGKISLRMICMRPGHEAEGNDIPAMIESGRMALSAGNHAYVEVKIEPDDCCALLFTSGTTGLAKGVMLSHKNIVSNVRNMSKFVRVTKDDVGLSVLPMHHTYEMTCHIFTSFYQGMPVAICEGLKHILKNMAEAEVTIMLAVPLILKICTRRFLRLRCKRESSTE